MNTARYLSAGGGAVIGNLGSLGLATARAGLDAASGDPGGGVGRIADALGNTAVQAGSSIDQSSDIRLRQPSSFVC